MNDKRLASIPFFTSLLFSGIIFIVLVLLRKSIASEQALHWITYASLVLVSIVAIAVLTFYPVADLFFPKLTKFRPIVGAIPNAILIYFGFLAMSLSFYRDMLLNTRWDFSMFGLGLAIAAFGFAGFKTSVSEDTLDALRDKSSDLGEKIVSLNEKLSSIENLISSFQKNRENVPKH
jgi:hypothetical protein